MLDDSLMMYLNAEDWFMIDDMLTVMASGEWMDSREIAAALYERDPVRYRNVSRSYIPPRIRTLTDQGYNIEKESGRVKGIVWTRYRLVLRWRCR